MKRALLLCTLALSSLGFVGSARADNFAISFLDPGGGVISSGAFTVDTTALGSGAFQVIGVEPGGSAVTASGTFAVTGISSELYADNVLYFPPAPNFFDGDGLSFTLFDGAVINLYGAGGTSTWALELLADGSRFTNPVNVTVTPVQSISPVPEPSSIILVGTSVLGIVGLLRKRYYA